MKKRLFLIAIAIITFALQASAVLKEKDLKNTLSILRNELTEVHMEQERRTVMLREQNDKVRTTMFSILEKSNQNSLMLYSQKPGYVFDLTYACHEATHQFHDFKKSSLPFRSYMKQFDTEIARYDSLVTTLKNMPSMTLDERGRTDRNVCLTLAVNIRNTMVENKEALSEYINMYNKTEQHLKSLNDYANKRYGDIQRKIFMNSGDNYFTILASLKRHVTTTTETVSDKYRSSRKTHSQWDSRMIFGLFMVILFYSIVSIIINLVSIKYLMPKKFRTEAFMAKRSCIIMATTVVTFAIILGVIRATIEQNFILMASDLLVEYAWLLGVILISLLLRVEGGQTISAFRIYSPLIFVGFTVISFRIILIPNDLVNLIFPPVLLLCSIWQRHAIKHHGKNIPGSDAIYTYISLAIFIASTVCSWMGYTLLSVQILIWWIMQLTCILTITCMVGWMKQYSERKDIDTLPITKTWFFRLIYSVALPVTGLFSIMLSIYWAADVFNLSDLTWKIFTMKFVDTENFSVNILSIIIVISLYFFFGYINRVSLEMLKLHLNKGDKKMADSRTIMGKNIIQAVVWIVWLIVCLSILNVNSTWLVVISGGLSTGIGFASKDILENFYYGISLMTGRIKAGDWIECDGIKGRVSSISYTSTLIEAIDGSVIAFQNSQLFTKNYKNLTRNHGYVLSSIPFGVAYGSNVKEVCAMVEKAVTNMKHPYINKKKAIKVVFTELGDSSINFKLLCWVDVTKQTFAISDIIECIYNVLNENNIEIPFPQQDVYIKGGIPNSTLNTEKS